jgi:hypothetical protein
MLPIIVIFLIVGGSWVFIVDTCFKLREMYSWMQEERENKEQQ